MNKIFLLLGIFCLSFLNIFAEDGKKNEYMILANRQVVQDSAWNRVVKALQEKHAGAALAVFEQSPAEALDQLREVFPRYVAVVELPENLHRDYIIDLNCMSRNIDDDIYADFLWGIITGYDAEAALRMVNDATEPLVVKTAVSTITELSSAKWFDRYAWVDDHEKGLWGEKPEAGKKVKTYKIPLNQTLQKFVDIYEACDPDLVVTASHATQRNLEMPYSVGNIKAEGGKLYADFKDGKRFLNESGKRRVYLPIGNCLIGDMARTKNSMAAAWMNSAHASAYVGYVVPTWYGRNGWGGLKYWLTTPGRYTLAEAFYLNQQDMLYQLNEWRPELRYSRYFGDNYHWVRMERKGVEKEGSRGYLTYVVHTAGQPVKGIETKTLPNGECEVVVSFQVGNRQGLTKDEKGFFHDRDVLVFYGDPLWDVRLQEIPKENDFAVTMEKKDGQCIVTITTDKHFSLERMQGDHFKEEHVGNLPFSYFFPERLKNPRLAEGQEWKAAVDENFLLLYNPGFKPGKTYQVVLDIDE